MYVVLNKKIVLVDDVYYCIYLEAEKIYFTTPLNPKQFLFLNDSLVLTKCNHEKHYLAEIYNFNTGKLINKCIPKGRGDSELLQITSLTGMANHWLNTILIKFYMICILMILKVFFMACIRIGRAILKCIK